LAHAVVGLAVLGVVVLACAALAALVHVAIRPRSTDDVRPAAALRELEPRGGRHRFHARLFDAVVLLSVWNAGLALLAVFAVAHVDAATSGARVPAGFVSGALVTTTWWLWRRGALRWPASPLDVEERDG